MVYSLYLLISIGRLWSVLCELIPLASKLNPLVCGNPSAGRGQNPHKCLSSDRREVTENGREKTRSHVAVRNVWASLLQKWHAWPHMSWDDTAGKSSPTEDKTRVWSQWTGPKPALQPPPPPYEPKRTLSFLLSALPHNEYANDFARNKSSPCKMRC